MSKSVVLLGLLLVAACTRTEAVPTTITQTVDRPVKVACLKPGQRPKKPASLRQDTGVAPATLTEMVGRLRAKIRQWSAYGEKADDLLSICERIQ